MSHPLASSTNSPENARLNLAYLYEENEKSQVQNFNKGSGQSNALQLNSKKTAEAKTQPDDNVQTNELSQLADKIGIYFQQNPDRAPRPGQVVKVTIRRDDGSSIKTRVVLNG